MNMSLSISNRRRIIAVVSLFAVSLFFLSNTVQVLTDEGKHPSQTEIAISGFIALVNAVLMIAAILGITHLLKKKADWIGLVGGTLAIIGWMAATRMSSVFQLNALFNGGIENIPSNAIEIAFKSAPAVWGSVFPMGIFYPAGLITVGIALFWFKPVNRWLGLLLALGGILFPIGRAANVIPAVIACDIVLASAFTLIGLVILSHPDIWEAS